MVPPVQLEPVSLDAAGCRELADVLGDTPETVIADHVLRRGVARAYVVGRLPRFAAAVVENFAFNADELIGFGDDPSVLWDVLRSLSGWSCVEVTAAVAPALGPLVAAATGSPVRSLDAIYHVLARPVVPFRHEAVRLLTPADTDLLERAPDGLRGAGYRSARELLTDGIAAAAVVDGGIAAIAHTSARSARHADIGVGTVAAWRGRGLATAAAALVAERIQGPGQIPVWSTGATNPASLRVARKLGFVEVARRTYVIR